MSAKPLILSGLDMSEMIIQSYLKDLGDADLLIRPVEGQNHIAWQLGHLIDSERNMLNGIKPGASPELPPGFAENYGRDEASVKSDDPSRFATKDEYFTLWKAQRDATKGVLESLSETDLEAEGPERMRQMAPTVGHLMMLIGNHALMHAGQFVSVRRKLGKPVSF